ncbi:MAG: hypothetical protein QOJ50_1433, partial [Cryptosporangiaceae bacterium]|nr:hypothetical protein [Cryptosporangiaceae bacterium]
MVTLNLERVSSHDGPTQVHSGRSDRVK